MEKATTHTQNNARILVAEDCEVVRTIICALLENDGMARVASTANFTDAMALIEAEGPFDFVLLDFNMPGMEGLQSLDRMIAANGQNPVGLISGGIPFDVVEKAVLRGASGYIPKVLAPRLIVQAIREMSQGQKFEPDHFLTLAKEAA